MKRKLTVITITAVLALLAGVIWRAYPPASPKSVEMLVTEFGEHDSPDGFWRVSVSSTDRTCKISHDFHVGDISTNVKGVVIPFDSNVTGTDSSEGWRAQPGWCVFVENHTNVWCYDGDSDLWLLHREPDGSSGAYGPGGFPCAVPPQMSARLNDKLRKEITVAASERADRQ